MCATCGCGKPKDKHGMKTLAAANKKYAKKGSKTIKAAGEKHTVKKNNKGDVIVDHAGNKGKYDKINLTKKGGAKTVKQGVKAVKDWHKKNG